MYVNVCVSCVTDLLVAGLVRGGHLNVWDLVLIVKLLPLSAELSAELRERERGLLLKHKNKKTQKRERREQMREGREKSSDIGEPQHGKALGRDRGTEGQRDRGTERGR